MDEPIIGPWLAGKKVLVTGATGYLGSALVEKLLRACADLHTVYVLVRPKRGEDVQTRLRTMLDSPLFAGHRPELLKRVVVGVSGDVTLPSLGLSDEDRALMTSQVGLVFHSAASINFNSALKSIVKTNLLGTRRVLELCREMEGLQALVYVSTAYCNCHYGDVLEEKVFPSDHEPNHVIEVMEGMTPEEAKRETRRLIGPHPNTYSFTKLLTENLLQEERGEIPVAIVRPTIVLGTLTEPFPGWVDNVTTGAFAFIAGASRGIFRSVLVDREKVADFVPCDQVVNLMIAAAWRAANRPGLTVYHYSSGSENPLTWGEYVDLVMRYVREYPCKILFWYPGAKCRESAWKNTLAVFLFQIVPAQLVDLAAGALGTKIIVDSLVSIQHKFNRGQEQLKFFTKRQWQFKMAAAKELRDEMSAADRATFDFDISTVHWPEFLKANVLGLRHYFHKEKPETLSKARQWLTWWWLLHLFTILMLVVMFAVTLNMAVGNPWITVLLPLSALAFISWL